MTNTETTPIKPKILLGLHDSVIEAITRQICLRCGYECVSVPTSAKFLSEMKSQNYDRHLKDANFGISNGEDLTPARLAHSTLVSMIGKEKANKRILIVTGNPDYAEILSSEGIHAECQPLSYTRLKAFLG